MMPVRLEPVTPRSRVKHSTTEPVRLSVLMKDLCLDYIVHVHIIKIHKAKIKFVKKGNNPKCIKPSRIY